MPISARVGSSQFMHDSAAYDFFVARTIVSARTRLHVRTRLLRSCERSPYAGAPDRLPTCLAARRRDLFPIWPLARVLRRHIWQSATRIAGLAAMRGRRAGLLSLVAVVGPGLLPGQSDDDPELDQAAERAGLTRWQRRRRIVDVVTEWLA